MIDIFIRVHRKNPLDSWQRVLSFQNEKHLKEYAEHISKYPDVLNVEVIPVPTRNDITYNEYIKEHFNADK